MGLSRLRDGLSFPFLILRVECSSCDQAWSFAWQRSCHREIGPVQVTHPATKKLGSKPTKRSKRLIREKTETSCIGAKIQRRADRALASNQVVSRRRLSLCQRLKAIELLVSHNCRIWSLEWTWLRSFRTTRSAYIRSSARLRYGMSLVLGSCASARLSSAQSHSCFLVSVSPA
jgi:hypothetical protein